MSSGVTRRVTGAVEGTGAVLQVRTVGFRPRRVAFLNVDGLVTGEWQDTMADDSVAKRVTGGAMTVPASDGVTPLNDGFQLGVDADLNVAGEVVHYSAEE